MRLSFLPFRIRVPYLLLLACMTLFTYKFVQKAQEINTLRAERSALQYQNLKTEQDNVRLRQEIRHYKSPDYVGQQARAVLGYTKPGEVSIQVQPRYPRYVRAALSRGPATRPAPVWQRWVHAFFG